MSEENEISVTSDGVTLKGDVVDDVRAPIKRVADTADSVLRLVDNVVGLPLDFISTHLETFRNSYRKEYENIPEEKLILPNFKTNCSVIQNVAYSAEEPEIQKLFAHLLASASDSDIAEMVHPAFASIISEMTTIDAKLLEDFNLYGTESKIGNALVEEEKVLIPQSISNLTRLGLIEYQDDPYSLNELRTFVGKQHYSGRSRGDLNKTVGELIKTVGELINDVQQLKNNIIKDRQSTMTRRRMKLTQLGEDFVAVVLKKMINKPSKRDALTGAPS
jgi:hypothetical protein